MTKKPSTIKHYLKAKSPELLKALMLKNGIEKRCYIDYLINHDGQNWFAWYDWDSDSSIVEMVELDEINAIR
jgi:DNA primase